MGTIVRFAVREGGGQKPAPRTDCVITIFTGVRYERADTAPPPVVPRPPVFHRDEPGA